jgi:hypothetical protein
MTGCLMIFDRTTAYDSKRRQKLARSRSTWLSWPCPPSSNGRGPPSPPTDPTTRRASCIWAGTRSWLTRSSVRSDSPRC